MDLGHAVTSISGRAGFGQHVDEALQGLVPRVDTQSVRASAVADKNVIQTLVSDDWDTIDHLGRTNVHIKQASRPKLAQHLRVGGPIDIGSVTCNGMSHVRFAVGVAAVHRHRYGINHTVT